MIYISITLFFQQSKLKLVIVNTFQRNAFQPSAEESEYESMDEKLQDLLEAKEGVDEAAPDADLNNKYTSKRKYIRTKHGDLEGK